MLDLLGRDLGTDKRACDGCLSLLLILLDAVRPLHLAPAPINREGATLPEVEEQRSPVGTIKQPPAAERVQDHRLALLPIDADVGALETAGKKWQFGHQTVCEAIETVVAPSLRLLLLLLILSHLRYPATHVVLECMEGVKIVSTYATAYAWVERLPFLLQFSLSALLPFNKRDARLRLLLLRLVCFVAG